MKVMWMCNTLIPEIGEQHGIVYAKPESWITALYDEMKEQHDLRIIYLFPAKEKKQIHVEGAHAFWGYTREDAEKEISDLLMQYAPDVIHVFGSENPSLPKLISAATKQGKINRVVIGIQGLLYYISQHYCTGLPEYVVHQSTFRDFVRKGNIQQTQRNFRRRGLAEIEAFRSVRHVIGRTDWDRACMHQINPMANYHYCNELLRKEFFTMKWSRQNCEEYAIFVSQSYYPVKGFHLMLEAMAEIRKHYPKAQLYTTGKSPSPKTVKERLLQTSYQRYLSKLIAKYDLKDCVHFLGTLTAKEMMERFLSSHVFVCCSTIENSSNAVGEALLLGVPTVASDVGGMKSMIKHEQTGVLYQVDAPYMLAYEVIRLFSDDTYAYRLSTNAMTFATSAYCAKECVAQMMSIYNNISMTAEEI